MTLQERLLRNPYVVTVATKVLVVLLGVVNSIFINRFLGAGLKGQYSYVINYVVMISIFMNFGVYQGYSHFRKHKVENLKFKFVQFFKLQFILNLALVIIFLQFVRFDNSYFFLLIPVQVMTKQMDFITVIENINVRNLVKITATSFYSLAIISVFFLVDEPSLIFIFAIVLFQQSIAILLKIKLIDVPVLSISRHTDWSLLREAVKIGILPLLTILLITSNYRIDIFILGELAEFADIGVYSLAVNLGGQLWLIPDAFKDVLFSKNARKNDVKAIVNAIKFNLVLSLLIMVFFILIGQPLIRLLYRAEFERAYMPLVIIITGNIFMIFYKFIYTLFISDGKRLVSVIIFIIAVSVNIVLNILLIPTYNINGAAFASLVSYSMCGIAFFAVFSRSYDVPIRSIIITPKDMVGYAKLILQKVRKTDG